MRRTLVAVALVLSFKAFAHAKTVDENSVSRVWHPPFKVGPECTGGLSVDDGSFENGYGFGILVPIGNVAQRFDLPGESNRIDAVCVCMSQLPIGSILNPLDLLWQGDIVIWAADGPGGAPGTELAAVPAVFSQPQIGRAFHRFDLGGVEVDERRVYIGPSWSPLLETAQYFVCADENGAGQAVGYTQGGAGPWEPTQLDFPQHEAVGIRVEASEVVDPDPPAGLWLTTAQLPGYQFKVRINGSQAGTQVSDCVPETLCVAGQIPTRSELFLRVIGPRPNGFLWVQAVKFTTSRLEIWVQRTSTQQVNYYNLEAVPQDASELPGLVDKEAFAP